MNFYGTSSNGKQHQRTVLSTESKATGISRKTEITAHGMFKNMSQKEIFLIQPGLVRSQ